jgi:HEAT repeat protein
MMKKMEILALSGLLIFCMAGCGRREKAALRQKEETIRILEEQIEVLRAEVNSLRSLLAEKEGLAVELAGLLRQAQSEGSVPPPASSAKPEEPQAAAAQPTAPPAVKTSPLQEALARAASRKAGPLSPEDEIAILKEENQRLAAQVDSLRDLLAKAQAVPAAAASAEPTALPVFQNPQIGSAYESFLQSSSSAQRVEVLDSLQTYAIEQDREILPILDRALDDPNPEVVQSAAGLLELFKTSEVLPLIEKALHSRDEQTRLSALSPLEEIADPKAAELAVLALSDPSLSVRGQALEVIRGQPEEIQILSLSRAMETAADEVKSDVLSLLELRGDKPAVEVILVGLKDPNPQFQEEAKRILQFLLDQEFNSYDQAAGWWKANRDRYDENLFEK